MNPEVKAHVSDYLVKTGQIVNDEIIADTIQEAKEVWRDEGSYRRHWRDHFIVVELDSMKIGFMGAATTGDDSPRDKGWEFNPDTICKVEPVKVEVTTYRLVAT